MHPSVRSLAVILNAVSLYGIALVLAAVFAAQFLLGELPCPLCLMQRIQFAMLAVGPVLNIRFGPRPSHYAVSLLSAVAGAGFAMRQVLLHVTPGDAGYGTALLGYHYYSWAFMGFAVAIVLIAIIMLFDGQFVGAEFDKPVAVGWFGCGAVLLVTAFVALNVVSTLLECGFGACPDNPTTYKLLQLPR